MKLTLENTWLDLRPGVRLFVEAGTLEIDDVTADVNAHSIAAAPVSRPASAKPEKPRKRKVKKGFNRSQRMRDPSYGPLENDILVTLSKDQTGEKFYPLGEVFKLVRPETPPRDGFTPSPEYSRLRTALNHLIQDGYIETYRVAAGRIGYRLSPNMNNSDPSAPSH